MRLRARVCALRSAPRTSAPPSRLQAARSAVIWLEVRDADEWRRRLRRPAPALSATPPAAPHPCPARDPRLPAIELLPLPAKLRAWKLPEVMQLYLQHQDVKADLAKKKRRGVDFTRFRAHCELVPVEIRTLFWIEAPEEAANGSSRHAANGRRQARTCARIDDALEAAMASQALREAD